MKQVLMGLDDPYPLGEMESEKQSSYPGKILDLGGKSGNFNSKHNVMPFGNDNVIQWLCGDDEVAKEKLVNRILG